MLHAPSVLGILFCILLLVFSTPAVYAAREGLTLWWTMVFPALFPFFVCTTLLQKSGVLYRAAGEATKQERTHKKSRYAAPILLLSAVSGYPGAAKLCGLLYEDRALSFSEAERLTVTCNLCSPMFLLGALCTGMLGAPFLFPLTLAAHYIGAAVCYALYPRLFPASAEAAAVRSAPFTPVPLLQALPAAIADGMWGLLKVCGSIVFFMVLSVCCEMLTASVFPAAAGSLGSALFLGLLEMTGGCHRLSGLALPLRTVSALCCGLVSFGGLSVLMQALSFMKLAHPGRYLLTKALHGLLSGISCWLLFPLLPKATSAFSASGLSFNVKNALTGASLLFASTLSMGVALLLSVFACYIIKKTAGKTPA